MTITLEAIPKMPQFVEGDDLGEVICSQLLQHEMKLIDGDVLCVASKVVSICEGRQQNLSMVQVSKLALEIHQRVPRKDPRIIQLMIDESGDETGARLEVSGNWIGCWLPNGLMLTSAGIDKVNEDCVMLLPKNPDLSAKKISDTIYEKLEIRVGIIITDSDGRIDKKERRK